MHGLDGRLDLVRAGLVPPKATADHGLAFGDQGPVPAVPVLVGEQDQLAVGVAARGPARVGEQHQPEQSQHLGLVRHQFGKQPPQPDRLGTQVVADERRPRACRIALIENEIEDGEHGAEPAGKVGLGRDPVRDSRVADLALGPDQPLRHGRLRDEEGMRDLRRGEPAQQPQGQRDLGGLRERRVTAGEYQAQPVVAHGALLGRFVAGVQQGSLGLPVLTGRLPAEAVDGPVAGGGDDPAGRARRQAVRWPPLYRHGERVLYRIFGDVEVAEGAGQDGHRAAVLGAEDVFDLRGRRGRRAGHQSSVSPWNGRTSMGRPVTSA